MPQSPETINDITRAIQLALAPVFLFTGIAGMLNVMTGRLSRIIDRGRSLTEGRVTVYAGAALDHQLELLERGGATSASRSRRARSRRCWSAWSS